MNVNSGASYERALDRIGLKLHLAPTYSRSISLKVIPIDEKHDARPTLTPRVETFSGHFEFQSSDHDRVIIPSKNYDRLIKAYTLEKVNNEINGDGGIKVDNSFYPLIHNMMQSKRKWGQEFKFRGKANFFPKLIEWTQLILVCYKETLLAADIFGAVAVSCYPYHFVPNTWKAFCELWGALSNTLHVGSGEMGISLQDIQLIGGLPITGEYYEEFIPGNEHLYSESDAIEKHYLIAGELLRIHAELCIHHGTHELKWNLWLNHFFRGEPIYSAFREDGKVAAVMVNTSPNGGRKRNGKGKQISHAIPEQAETKEEIPLEVSKDGALAAYLALWLSRFVFPHGSNIVRPETFHMASVMATGNKVSLAPTVLGYIYHGMRKIATHRINPGQADVSFPIHYVIGWLAEYFPTLYPSWQPGAFGEESDSYPLLIKYAGLKPTPKDISEVRVLFRRIPNSSFRRFSFPEKKGFFYYDNCDLSADRFDFLISIRSGVLPVRVGDILCLEPYYPNRFARQFGLDQGVPTNKLRFSVSQRDNRSLKDLAEAKASLFLKDTGIYFYIPQMYQQPSCTYWYCRWWGRVSSPYLTQPINKVYSVFSEKTNVNEATFVIRNIRSFTSVEKPGITAPRQKLALGHGDVPRLNRSGKRKSYINDLGENNGSKRPRDDKFESTSHTSDGHEGDTTLLDCTLDDTPVVDRKTTISTVTSRRFLPEETQPNFSGDVPCLQPFAVTTGAGEEIDDLTSDYICKLMKNVVEYLTVSSVSDKVSGVRAQVNQLMGLIRNFTSNIQGKHKKTFDDFENKVNRCLELSEVEIKTDANLDALDIHYIKTLSGYLEECRKEKDAIFSEMSSFVLKLEEFERREAEILDMQKQLGVDRSSYCNLTNQRMTELSASLREKNILEAGLRESLREAGYDKFQASKLHKEELKIEISSLDQFSKKYI